MPIVLKKYSKLKDNIDINNLIILNEIFEKIDKYELKSTNVLFDNLIIDGLVMIPSKKETMDNLKSVETENILKIINQKVDKNLINMKTSGDELIITSFASEIGKSEESILVSKNTTQDISISYSAKYMLDALKTFKEEDLIILMNGDAKPIIMKNAKDESLIQLILPIKTY